jgi:hypothetical protein
MINIEKQRQAVIGCIVNLYKINGAFPGDTYVITRWTPQGWPCFKRTRDPKWFGDFVVQRQDAVDAAMNAITIRK